MADKEDQNYKENKEETRPSRLLFKKLEQIYVKRAERDRKELPGTAQQPSWLLNNTYFCYDGESATNNDNKKKKFTA